MRQPNSDLCFYVVNLIFAYLLFMVELGYQKVKPENLNVKTKTDSLRTRNSHFAVGIYFVTVRHAKNRTV